MAESGRDARLLEQLASALEPRRAPFYVQAQPGGQPDGWYWVPAGADSAKWLGRNVIFAQQQLVKRLKDVERGQAA